MQKGKACYTGKAKTLYATDVEHVLIADFRDDTSAFDGVKKSKLAHKGAVNNQISAYIMQQLEAAGIATHFERLIDSTQSLVKRLDMIPIECVCRNLAAGSLCRRLGVEKGREFDPPLFEFFYKDDELHDPMVNDEHILAFAWATADEIQQLKSKTMQINAVLKPLFLQAGMLLVDFKLEFGRYQGQLVLGDEFTPDGCRIWDVKTNETMDKDRFRQDLGSVVENYEEVAKRLGVSLLENVVV